jgi:hypothetical protein
MLRGTKLAVCSEINTIHTNTVWAEHTVHLTSVLYKLMAHNI